MSSYMVDRYKLLYIVVSSLVLYLILIILLMMIIIIIIMIIIDQNTCRLLLQAWSNLDMCICAC